MRKLFNNKWFLASVVIIGFAWAFMGLSDYSAMAGITALFALLQLLQVYEGERNWKVIKEAMDDYEEIIGGTLWSGKDAEVLASDRVDNPREAGPIRFEHICRTKNGAWFIFSVSVVQGRIIDRDCRPCDEEKARQRLERHQDAYILCFGKPTAA